MTVYVLLDTVCITRQMLCIGGRGGILFMCVARNVNTGKGKMSIWLCDAYGWIGANRPKSTGRGECVASTDGVAIAMG